MFIFRVGIDEEKTRGLFFDPFRERATTVYRDGSPGPAMRSRRYWRFAHDRIECYFVHARARPRGNAAVRIARRRGAVGVGFNTGVPRYR